MKNRTLEVSCLELQSDFLVSKQDCISLKMALSCEPGGRKSFWVAWSIFLFPTHSNAERVALQLNVL